jgi:SPP1 family predicted phage head-tail adaptor
MWKDIAQLITYTETKDDIGDTIQTPSERQVFVNKKSVRQNEYYQSLSQGLKPELMLEIRTIDYENESELKFDNKKYRIMRTYDRNGEITELVCEKVI